MKRDELLKQFGNIDTSLAAFTKKLKVNDEYDIIGIRVPVLRKMGKNLAKTEGKTVLDDFLSYNEKPYYEEVLLIYFTYLQLAKKMDRVESLSYIDQLLKYNNSWATNDALVTTLTIKKADKPFYFEHLKGKLESEEPYDLRFAVIAFMGYFLDDEYISRVLNILSKIESNHYYVNMAIAWALATSLAKQRELTLPYFLEENKINSIVLKMAISKAIESFRISKEDKELLRLRRKTIIL